MNIVNLTPHTITIFDIYGDEIKVLSSGVARCEETEENVLLIDTIPVSRKTYGKVYDLPEPKENTIYVVSYIVLKVLNNTRTDVFCVGSTIKDEDGKIVGCLGLSTL